MSSAPHSNPASRFVRGLRATLPAALLLGGACQTPFERELALALSATALPGAGAGLSLAQGMTELDGRRIDFELGLERQDLADEGPEGDDWTRAWVGLRCMPREPGQHFEGSLGVTWVRSTGESAALSDPGDFGGAYLGLGWILELLAALSTGPELTLLYVDSEGDRSGSGAVAELAWRWVWHL